ncbi:uncharacterized protein SAPINGB_P005050 [Magnusiomyces paraingens]|uniref:Tetrapyrrole biosynthesis uroporphyrinogen III synthase domain-containing protein n=1 Tax=Magnusiomyces paraingens TaxID=2606893 RepID=A0A5E8BZ95_9ASCO|nr:uncharacterized protein SAPINGB_P005050 [Saprochaete ingens]VVT56422.1 unnamed protein product [Saprochaete ingens]
MTAPTSTTKASVPNRRIYLFKNKTVPKDPYHDLFLEHGFEPVFVPLLRHKFINTDELRMLVQSAEFQNGNSAIIITSQRAIEAVNEVHASVGPEAQQALVSRPVYTVGPASAAALARAGYKDVRGGASAGNGSVLSEIIVRESEERPGEIGEYVFFTGVTRRDIIPVRLREARLRLAERVVYQTLAIENLEEHVLRLISEELEHVEEEEEGENGEELEQEVVEEIEEELLEDLKKKAGGEGEEGGDRPDPYYVFFSPAEADPVVEAVRRISEHRAVRVAAIGPTTEEYLEGKRLPARVVARKPDAVHLVAAIEEDLKII